MSASDWTLILRAGGAMCLAAGGYLLLLLRLWPRVFLRRYPAQVQAAVPPLSRRERLLGMLAALPFLSALLGFPAWTAWTANARHGGDATFLSLFLAAFGVWMIFNLFDWLVLDELCIGLLRPRWLILPGTEHLDLRFDHAEHASAFVKGSIGGAAVAALIALGLS